jgi:glycolate dehydrogenase iron-sulfur subunit
LLQAIPGLTFVEMEGSDRCCGSAGIYNITHSGMSRHLLEEKMQSIASARTEAVVAPNPGCMLQLRFGAQQFGPNIEVYHLMDLLERSYRAAESTPPK